MPDQPAEGGEIDETSAEAPTFNETPDDSTTLVEKLRRGSSQTHRRRSR